jgi:predicted TIM-barrel fold metal-dependent hydrolase
MRPKSDPDSVVTTSISFGPASNGEFEPVPANVRAERAVQRLADGASRRAGLSRREWLRSACGTAGALVVLNELSGCRAYQVPDDALHDRAAAREALGGGEFVLDCQTHHVDAAEGAVWQQLNPQYREIFEMASAQSACGKAGKLACLARETYVHEVFAASDTTVAMLSGVPSMSGNPLDNDAIIATREIVAHAAASERLLIQQVVYPNGGPKELEAMEQLAARHVAGFKVYTPYVGTPARPFWLDDQEIGLPFLERVQKVLPRPVVFLHKGLPWPIWDAERASPRDIGPAARQVPGVTLVVYHSGYEPTVIEGPYDPQGKGIDRLIKSCADAGIGKNGNVYAELGGTWFVLMQKPVEAAHTLGKLLTYFGEDRVLWGTDSLFLGTPQGQLDAFRAFQIPPELREKHGYPALTAQIKQKILGLNAARLLGVDPAATRYRITAGLEGLKARAAELGPLGPPTWGPRSRRALLEHQLRQLRRG